MLSQRPQGSHRQKEQGLDDHYHPEQQEAEGEAVVPQGPQAEGARFLLSEIGRHGHGRNNRQKAGENDSEARGNVPRDGSGRGAGVA